MYVCARFLSIFQHMIWFQPSAKVWNRCAKWKKREKNKENRKQFRENWKSNNYMLVESRAQVDIGIKKNNNLKSCSKLQSLCSGHTYYMYAILVRAFFFRCFSSENYASLQNQTDDCRGTYIVTKQIHRITSDNSVRFSQFQFF